MFQLQLRQSLIDGGHETFKTFCNPNDENNNYQYDGGIPDFGETDFDDLPEHMCMHEDIPLHDEKVRQTCNMIVLYIHNKSSEIFLDCLFVDLYTGR